MRPGTTFDPDAFGAFLRAQPDLGTLWAPREVWVVDGRISRTAPAGRQAGSATRATASSAASDSTAVTRAPMRASTAAP